jgi:hypothetical protein
MERIQASAAKPAAEMAVANEKATVRADGLGAIEIKKTEKLEPGIAMARQAMCLVHAKGDHDKAFRLAQKYYP